MLPQGRVRNRKLSRPTPPRRRLIIVAAACISVLALAVALVHPKGNIAHQLSAKELALPFSLPAVNGSAAQAAIVPSTALPFPLREEMKDLSTKLKVTAQQPKLKAGIFIVEPDTGRYLDIDAKRAYAAASMIKLPVLVEMLQAIDESSFSMA